SRSDRQCAAANLLVLKVPFRWTRITSSQSCSARLKIIRSRRMPATLTTMSSLPNCSTAVRTSRSPVATLPMSPPSATAWPPAATISSATCLAGPSSPPVPSGAPPRSLMTRLAPSAANSRLIEAPMPLAPPVMIATRPSMTPICAESLLPKLRAPVSQHEAAGGAEEHADALHEADRDAGHLRERLAAQLPHGLLDGEHAVHAGVRVGKAAAAGVHGQRAALTGVAFGDERGRLAAADEPAVFEHVKRQVRERVVAHEVVDVGMGHAGLAERLGAGPAERAER